MSLGPAGPSFQKPHSASSSIRRQSSVASSNLFQSRRSSAVSALPIRSRAGSQSSTRGRSSPYSSTASTATSRSSRSSSYLRQRTNAASTQSRQPPRSSSAWPRSTSLPQTNASGESLGEVDPDEDALNEVVMAVDMRERASVGCAYYVARDEKLYLMEDVKLGTVDVIDSLKLFVEPTVVLISTRADDAIVNLLDPEAHAGSLARGNDGQFRLPYLLDIRPSGEFSYEGAKNKLLSLNLGGANNARMSLLVPGDLQTGDGVIDADDVYSSGGQNRLMQLGCWINMDSKVTIGCAGALIAYLQRRRAATFLPGDAAAQALFRISAIEMFSLTGSMFVNADTLLSLQIIQADFHPHSHNQGPTISASGTKEGLSVYGLFHHLARTPQGRHLLRQYFLRPSLDLDVIQERHNAILVLTRPDNANEVEGLAMHLARVKNMRTALIQVRKGINGGGGSGIGISRAVWPSLRNFVYNALKICDVLQEVSGVESLAVFQKIADSFERNSFGQIGRRISETIDFDESAEKGRTVVLRGIDVELDEMKRRFDGIENLLSSVADHVCSGVPRALGANLNVIFFPQIGFLIAMGLDPDTHEPVYDGSLEDPWEKIFSTEDNAYFKNGATHQMDDELGDIYTLICDREIEIVHELAQFVLEYEALLIRASDICGELDCLLALAQGARNYNLVRPRMSSQNVIDIKGGRHPLQELTVPSFVANDTFILGALNEARGDGTRLRTPSQSPQDTLYGTGPSLLLLTGPNYSGKSVYLKQVAIITLMAHVGSFVPATSAVIGITDKILTRISTRETVSKIQSAFIIDLQQIASALSLATSRSLIVVDEFGKGTDICDGAGLAAGVFDHLLSCKSKVVAATHLHEIFEGGYLQEREPLAFGHMEVQVDKTSSGDEDQITYLYNFRLGRSISSYGTFCAALNGVAPEVIQRAEELVALSVKGEDLVAVCAVMPPDEIHELEAAASTRANDQSKKLMNPGATC
ncbi:MAG: MutS protein msh5 [Bogoriella megaspora]|nr:MAG: MutS protein msh5 [Bogoriella megaspora]